MTIGYNVSLLHSIPLAIALTNIFTNQWVRYVGSITLDELLDIDIELNWGLYSINVITPLFNDIPFQMTIPNFIQYASNNVGIDFFKPTTLPLYYTVYVFYLIFLVNDIYHSLIGIREPFIPLTKETMKRRLMHVLAVTRIALGVFFLWSLFTYYGTDALCLNSYMNSSSNSSSTEEATYQKYREILWDENKNGGSGDGEICTYEWNIVTILIGEVISYGFAIHKFVICSTKRPRTNSDEGIRFNLLETTNVHPETSMNR